jgi:hypothetical protein
MYDTYSTILTFSAVHPLSRDHMGRMYSLNMSKRVPRTETMDSRGLNSFYAIDSLQYVCVLVGHITAHSYMQNQTKMISCPVKVSVLPCV